MIRQNNKSRFVEFTFNSFAILTYGMITDVHDFRFVVNKALYIQYHVNMKLCPLGEQNFLKLCPTWREIRCDVGLMSLPVDCILQASNYKLCV